MNSESFQNLNPHTVILSKLETYIHSVLYFTVGSVQLNLCSLKLKKSQNSEKFEKIQVEKYA